MPQQVGPHTIAVDYNGHPIYGTPYVCKVYDAKQVIVGNVPRGHVGNTLQFTGKLRFRKRPPNWTIDEVDLTDDDFCSQWMLVKPEKEIWR